MPSNVEKIEGHSEIMKVMLEGSIDESNLDILKGQVAPHMDDTSIRVIALDVTRLEYINSKVVGYIASLYTLGQVNNTKIMIVGENKAILDILSLVGLTTLIEQKKDMAELLGGLK